MQHLLQRRANETLGAELETASTNPTCVIAPQCQIYREPYHCSAMGIERPSWCNTCIHSLLFPEMHRQLCWPLSSFVVQQHHPPAPQTTSTNLICQISPVVPCHYSATTVTNHAHHPPPLGLQPTTGGEPQNLVCRVIPNSSSTQFHCVIPNT